MIFAANSRRHERKDMESAINLLLRISQRMSCPYELDLLFTSKALPLSSHLFFFYPLLGKGGLFVLGEHFNVPT